MSHTTVPISEDDLIKKRLLIEGDSGNEDRLINKLIKNFVKWSNSSYSSSSQAKPANGSTNGVANALVPSNSQELSINSSQTLAIGDEENSAENLYEQMMASLSHAEFGLLRNQFILDMNKMEQDK